MKCLFLGMLVALVVSFVVYASEICSSDTTEYTFHPKAIFTRKKRFIVFPNYASMKITVVTGKALLNRYPRGLNIGLEASTYYPLPTVLSEWFPKKPNRTMVTTKPRGKLGMMGPGNQRVSSTSGTEALNAAIVANSHPLDVLVPMHSESGVIWIPKSGWKTNISTILNQFGSRPPWSDASSLSMKMKSRINAGEDFMPHRYSWDPKYQPMQFSNRRKFYPETQSSYAKLRKYPKPKPISYQDQMPFKNWKYNRGHRDRRDLYDFFEGFATHFGLDIKTCILRSICETRSYLLPPGYSLFQDIIRILFSFPTLDGSSDDYSKEMNSQTDDCVEIYSKKCPISVIDFMLHGGKLIK